METEQFTKQFTAFLMDASDVADKIKKEVRAMKTKGLILQEEEYHAFKDLLLGMIDDLEIADSDLAEYERCGFVAKAFAAVK